MSTTTFKFRIVTATNGLLRDAQGTGAHPIQFDVHERHGIASVTLVLLYGTQEYRVVVANTTADDVLNAIEVLFAFAATGTLTVFSSNIAALSSAPVAMITRAALLEESAADIRAELMRVSAQLAAQASLAPRYVPLSPPLLAGTVTQPNSTLEFDLTSTIQQVGVAPYAIDVLMVLDHRSGGPAYVQASLELNQSGSDRVSHSGPMSYNGANVLLPFRATVAWSNDLLQTLVVKNAHLAAITPNSNIAVSIAGFHCTK